MVFINNKYYTIYYSIINNALQRSETPTHIERHHIIPKSLGGSNKKNNIVNLTPREHYVCHRLLVKITSGEERIKMSFAFWCLTNKRNGSYITSRLYEISKDLVRKANKSIGNRPPNHSGKQYENIYSDPIRVIEVKENLRKRMTGQSNPRYGVKLADEQKQKMIAGRGEITAEQRRIMSERMIGKTWKDRMGVEGAEEARKKTSAKLKGKKKSEEHCKNMSLCRIGKPTRPHTEESKKRMSEKRKMAATKKCIYCGAEMHPSLISRYHNDKCKQQSN